MGRKRKPINEVKKPLTVNLPLGVIKDLEMIGRKTTVASNIILQNYQEYLKNYKK